MPEPNFYNDKESLTDCICMFLKVVLKFHFPILSKNKLKKEKISKKEKRNLKNDRKIIALISICIYKGISLFLYNVS